MTTEQRVFYAGIGAGLALASVVIALAMLASRWWV